MITTYIYLAVFTCTTAVAQMPEDFRDEVDNLLSEVRKEDPDGPDVRDLPLELLSDANFMTEVSRYRNDDSKCVRMFVSAISTQVGKYVDEIEARRIAASLLLDLGAYRTLVDHFDSDDFGPGELDYIRTLASDKSIVPFKGTNPILLLGIAGFEEDLEILRTLSDTNGKSDSVDPSWQYLISLHAELAMARIGDPTALSECIERIDEKILKVPNYEFFRQLAYISRPESVQVLVELLNDDTVLPPAIAHGGRDIPVWAWAALALKDCIRPLPPFLEAQRKTLVLSDAVIGDEDEWRAWMNNPANWEIRR